MNLQKLQDEVNKLLTEFPPETEIMFKPNVLGYRYEKTYSSIDIVIKRFKTKTPVPSDGEDLTGNRETELDPAERLDHFQELENH